MMQLEDLPDQPVHSNDIARLSAKDHILSHVLGWVGRGWLTRKVGPDFATYASSHNKLSSHKGCVLWGSSIKVLPPLWQRVLEALCETHPGVVRMKVLSRS